MSVAQIAKSTQMSPATVSRVLNGHKGVSEDKVRRVLDASRRLGYSHKPRQRANSSSAPTILWAFSQRQGFNWLPYFPLMMQGVQDAVAEFGANLLTAEITTHDALPPMVLQGQIDGIICSSADVPDAVLEAFERYPLVWTTSHVTREGSQIIEGNATICQKALDYLIDRGHRDVGVVAVDNMHPAITQRADLFEFLCGKSGLGCRIYSGNMPDETISSQAKTDKLEEELYQALSRWKSQKNRSSALFFTSSTLIHLAYRVFTKLGIRPQSDVDIIACGQSEVVVNLFPRPALIEIPLNVIGIQAVGHLMSLMRFKDNRERAHISIEPRLIPCEEDPSRPHAWKETTH